MPAKTATRKAGAKKPARGRLEVQYVPIASLKPWKANPRNNDEAVASVVRSIERFGYTNPVLVRRADNRIIAGHTRIKALQQVGETHAPVIFLDLGATDADLYAIFDNKSTENTPWDPPKLADLFANLMELKADVTLTGFSPEEIQGYTGAGSSEPDPKDDVVPEPPKKAITKPGDLWLLGEHRLLCGDSTKAEDVERVMGGEKAGLCFTSPPYGQQRDYTEASKEKTADWDGLMQGVFGNLPMAYDGQVLVNLGLIHRDGEWLPYWDKWIEWMRSQGWRRFGWYVWDQGFGLPGDWNGRFGPSHEFVFHFNRAAIRPDKTVEKQPDSVCVKHGKGMRQKDGRVQSELTSPQACLATHKIPDSVIRINRNAECDPTARSQHPATFPVALPSAIIPCWPGICYEPFAGSGSSIIAAEKLGRRCYGMEIDPVYCDVIVARWEKFTGGKAKREKA